MLLLVVVCLVFGLCVHVTYVRTSDWEHMSGIELALKLISGEGTQRCLNEMQLV